MKTKLYRIITLVLAIVMLLGVTPAFAYGIVVTVPDPVIDGTRPVSQTGLSREDWENHRYTLIPYDANIAENPDEYIPFSSMWEYGDRTSAASKTDWTELKDGVCYVTNGSKSDSEKNYNVNKAAIATGGNAIPAYFDGNTHAKTAIVKASMPLSGGTFTTASALKTVICLKYVGWEDWTNSPAPGMKLYPSFPKNVTVVGGLIQGEMYIANSNNYNARKIFTNRNEFIEAVRPILASAHMTDEAWSLIPKEFNGQAEIDPFKNTLVSDWAKTEVLNASNVGIFTLNRADRGSTTDLRKTIAKPYAAKFIISTYEAVCNTKGISTGYPSVIPEVFGPNKSIDSENYLNKGAYLGILKGNGATSVYNGKTYSKFGNGNLTREQMAAMLTRLAKACGQTLPSKPMPFTDAMSDWAVPEVSACYGAGLIKGTSATTFAALDNMTYEQAIVLCYRAYVYLTNNA